MPRNRITTYDIRLWFNENTDRWIADASANIDGSWFRFHCGTGHLAPSLAIDEATKAICEYRTNLAIELFV